MRRKNQGIYQFILELEREKNRERALREKTEREEFLGPHELPVTPQYEGIVVFEKPLKPGIFDFAQKGRHLEVELGISAVLAVFSFISIIMLMHISALVNQNLSLNGFLSMLKTITPYWIVVHTALGMFWLVAIVAIIFRMHILAKKQLIQDQ